jgi:hypothetical protein
LPHSVRTRGWRVNAPAGALVSGPLRIIDLAAWAIMLVAHPRERLPAMPSRPAARRVPLALLGALLPGPALAPPRCASA